jgi:hypothetical protein
VTAREFEPGKRVEVDYAGDTLEWIELATGGDPQGVRLCRRPGFQSVAVCLGGRGHEEPKLARRASTDVCYGGAPHVTVPHCLKQGVLKCHLYDPDLNPGYKQLASHFATAVVR